MDYDNPENTALAGIEALENFYRRLALLLFKVFVVAVCDIYVHNLFTPALIAPS